MKKHWKTLLAFVLVIAGAATLTAASGTPAQEPEAETGAAALPGALAEAPQAGPEATVSGSTGPEGGTCLEGDGATALPLGGPVAGSSQCPTAGSACTAGQTCCFCSITGCFESSCTGGTWTSTSKCPSGESCDNTGVGGKCTSII